MHRLIVPLAVALALPAFARDALPLRHGFYVQEPTACAQASNATLRLFDGHGLSVSQAECRITGTQRAGDSFDVRQSCRDIRSGGQIDGVASRITPTRTGFEESAGSRTTRWRYCQQSQLPQPWRSNRIR